MWLDLFKYVIIVRIIIIYMLRKKVVFIALFIFLALNVFIATKQTDAPPTIDLPNFGAASLNTNIVADKFSSRDLKDIGLNECQRNTGNKFLLVNDSLQIFSEFLAKNISFPKENLSKLKFFYVVFDAFFKTFT